MIYTVAHGYSPPHSPEHVHFDLALQKVGISKLMKSISL